MVFEAAKLAQQKPAFMNIRPALAAANVVEAPQALRPFSSSPSKLETVSVSLEDRGSGTTVQLFNVVLLTSARYGLGEIPHPRTRVTEAWPMGDQIFG